MENSTETTKKGMTACQKIKKEILLWILDSLTEDGVEERLNETAKGVVTLLKGGVTEESVDSHYDAVAETGLTDEFESEFRSGYSEETELWCEGSRHYESKSVAAKHSDGSWVGWGNCSGGGKYGEPGEVPWMEDAYHLEVTETERLVTVREFKRTDGGS